MCQKTAAGTEDSRGVAFDRTAVVAWRSFVVEGAGRPDVVKKVVTGWSAYSVVVQYADVLWVALT